MQESSNWGLREQESIDNIARESIIQEIVSFVSNLFHSHK